MFRVLGALCLTGALCGGAAADTITLTSGGVMRNATVVKESGDTVVIELQVGKRRAQVVVARSDILKIERDPPPEPSHDVHGRPRRPDRLIKAFDLVQRGRPVEAEVALQPFLTDPKWQAEARYGLSLAREQTGDLDGAETQQRLAALLAPNHPWVQFHGAHLNHRRRRFKSAVAGYTRALALDPENPRLRAVVQRAIAAAQAGRVPRQPAASPQRPAADPKAAQVGDAAEAAKAVRTNPQLELRTHITGLQVLLDAHPRAVQAYAADGNAEAFRLAVTGLRVIVEVGAPWTAAAAQDRAMCLRQIHSALGHRYPHAAPVVEAFEGKRLAGAAWFHGERVLTRLWPAPAAGR